MKMILGKSPEELEAEKAKALREREAKIQQAAMERQQKINALHKKQKANKVIVICVASLITIVLLVFGTYNTFIKQGLTTDDVNAQITQNTSRLSFPAEGLDNYIRDNSQTFFNKYAAIDKDSEIESATVDKNSVNINRVIKMTDSLALVYFSADIEVKTADTQVIDQTVIENLKKNGFGVTNSTSKKKKKNKTTEEDMNVDDDSVKEDTSEVVEEAAEVEEESVASEEQTEAAETNDVVADDDTGTGTIDSLEVESKDGSTAAAEYYILDNGIVMQRGTTTSTRYNFYIPIEFYYTYADPETMQQPIANGYRPAGEMNLYSLEEINVNSLEEVTVHSTLQFDPNQVYDETETESAKIRVDKTFKEIYSGINTDHELKLSKKFNTYGATYVGMTGFEIYKTPNQLGYNAHVTYKIQLPQGFVYTIEDYLIVEKDGNSWVITSIL